MIIHYGVETLNPGWPSMVLTIGAFDGVHLGHQAVIREAVRIGRERNLPVGLLTFDRHPTVTLAPERAPQLISLPDENLRLIGGLGVDFAVVLAFDLALCKTSATDFLGRIIRGRLHATELVVGHDFALGAGREGTPEWLQAQIETVVVPPFEVSGERVSSSAIRAAIQAGELAKARDWLGRSYGLQGLVIHGDKLGRQLGYPTANVGLPAQHVLPPDGVYVAETDTPTGTFRTALSVGLRPTVDGSRRVIEAYLLDYDGASLYGRHVTVRPLQHLRGQMAFDSVEMLKTWIEKDVAMVAAWAESE